MQNFSFLRGWVLFLSKKSQFFEMKLHVFAGLGALFGTFFINFLSFFLNVPPISPTTPEGERAKRARLTRDADSRCTLAGGPQPLSIFVVMLQCVSQREPQPLLLFAADLLLP